jgi:hypothetical protein
LLADRGGVGVGAGHRPIRLADAEARGDRRVEHEQLDRQGVRRPQVEVRAGVGRHHPGVRHAVLAELAAAFGDQDGFGAR